METEDIKWVIRGFRNVGIGAATLAAIFGVTATMALYPLFLKSAASPAQYVGIGLGVTVVLALAAFGLFWGFGWVLAGIGIAIDERLRKRRDGIENGKDE